MASGVAIEAREETLENQGLKIFFRSWRPPTTHAESVVIVPGFNSHSGYYAWVAERFAGRGPRRLRPRSARTRQVRRRAILRRDVRRLRRATWPRSCTLVKSREPACRCSCSATAPVASSPACTRSSISGSSSGLICESFAFQMPAPDFALAVLKGLSHVAPHAHVLHLKNEDFSRDPQVVAAMNADPLIAHETQPTKTVAELVRRGRAAQGGVQRASHCRVLILHGTADKAAKPSGSQFFYDSAGSTDKTLKFYDGHVHDLLNDIDKEEVMADITTWTGARLTTSASGESRTVSADVR